MALAEPSGDLVTRFSGCALLVVGDVLVDRWVYGRTSRLCREGPVAVLDLDHEVDAPGGAGNCAVNAAALGADVRLVSAVGADPEAERLERALEDAGVDHWLLRMPDGRTPVKQRLCSDDQLLLRVDSGGLARPTTSLQESVALAVRRAWDDVDVVVISDYDHAVCSGQLPAVIAELQRQSPRQLVVDARHPRRWRRAAPTAMKPNFEEACGLLDVVVTAGEGNDRAVVVEEHAEALLERSGAGVLAVTLDTDGAVMLERGGRSHRLSARPAASRRAAGAGDTFTAALALALASGADAVTAGEVASAAAAVVVDKPGTARCSASELRVGLTGAGKLLDGPPQLAVALGAERARGRSVVFTNGCFDLLHRGHVAFLSRAKLLGDVLVVAVNSDASVARLKGGDRPVNALEDRVQVLAALGCVDYVVPFAADSPAELLVAATPDVYAKGGDYTEEMLPEAELLRGLGTTVRILPYLEDRSTSRLLELIRSPHGSAKAGGR